LPESAFPTTHRYAGTQVPRDGAPAPSGILFANPRPTAAEIDAAWEKNPGEAYAAQRAQRFRWLRFAPRLEAEYLEHMRMDQRVSTMVCALVAISVWLMFVVLDVRRLNAVAEIEGLHRAAIVIHALRASVLVLMLTQLGLILSGRARRSYPTLTWINLILIGSTATIISNIYKQHGLPHADLFEFAIIVAVFLPVGLTFLQSAATAGAITVLTALSSALMVDATELASHLRLTFMLLFTGCVCAVGAYLREHAEREQFLLSRLLHHHAMHDPLTGIGNRRHFEEQAVIQLDQARRDGAPVVLAVLDVDHFKRFNDRYGHHLGDVALRSVAEAIRGALRRPLDLVGRLGGEEFGILLYGANAEEAQKLLQGIVETVAGMQIAHDASTTSKYLTVSIGAAQFDGRETLEGLYRRADDVLYEAKAAGRNRVRVEASLQVVALRSRAPQMQRQR
jgi:diguanylate cyclase (GGDEF)-like protein